VGDELGAFLPNLNLIVNSHACTLCQSFRESSHLWKANGAEGEIVRVPAEGDQKSGEIKCRFAGGARKFVASWREAGRSLNTKRRALENSGALWLEAKVLQVELLDLSSGWRIPHN
jgi:hypothetical protein